jgi:hypothetical protein
MNSLEQSIVTEEFCLRKDTYNLCVGGKGGFSYVNRNRLNNNNKDLAALGQLSSMRNKGRKRPEFSEVLRNQHRNGSRPKVQSDGSGNSDEARAKKSASMKAKYADGNCHTGSFWVTDGEQNKKIKDVDSIPKGWYKGRVNVHKLRVVAQSLQEQS